MIASIASIFLFIFIVVRYNHSQVLIFADNTINIKEVDDAYISLDGAILEWEEGDFGARFAYVVKPWDTLDSIAREFGVTVASLKSTNNITSNVIRTGQEIIISRVEWFVYEVKQQTTIRDLALQYRLNLQDLKELNALQNDHDILRQGDQVFVPLTMEEWKKLGLIVPEPEPVVEVTKPAINTRPVARPTTPVRKTTTQAAWWVWRVSQSRAWCFGFVPWQCTCYAAQKRPDIFKPGQASPWRWNARQWYNNAKAAWYSVGTTPQVNAIAVMSQWWGGYGHVWIVIDINDDSILLESMNRVGPYIVNRVWVRKSQIRWYIY